MEMVERPRSRSHGGWQPVNSNTLLYRQVHPTQVIPSSNTLASAVFMPESKQANSISTYNGDLIKPEDALRHYRDDLGMKSDGVVGLAVGVFEQRGMTATHDGNGFREHVTVTYPEDKSINQRRQIARTLAKLATIWYAGGPDASTKD